MPAANGALSVRGRRWVQKECDTACAEKLSLELGVSSLTARILASRGITTPEAGYKFLNPTLDDLYNPSLLPDYEAAKSEILGAKERGEKIFIHGDYDVDGVTSTALFTRFLTKIGCDVVAHVPHRMKEGYGIHSTAVDKAHAAGCSLFLTCDCGVGAHEQVKQANALGMRVVVTDHHQVSPTLPEARAIVNPHRSDSEYPFQEICGAAVAFKLCAGIARDTGIDLKQYYRAFLDLAVLGTVADVMPLIDENRVITALGLRQLSASRKVGIQALLKRAVQNYQPGMALTSRAIGFQIGPRLNAAGRVDDAALSLELLLENDPKAADKLVDRIEDINQERRNETDRILEEALLVIENTGQGAEHMIVIGSDGWHPGIIGIVAGRITDRWHRPAALVSFAGDHGRGSARAIGGYHLADALTRATHLLESHGGHESAAGFSVKRGAFDEFVKHINADAKDRIPPEMMIPTQMIDAEITIGESNLEVLGEIDRIAPFGLANEQPLFLAKGMTVHSVTPTQNPVHVRVNLVDENGEMIEAMAFGAGEWEQPLKAGEKIDALTEAVVDEFRNVRRPKWFLRDVRRV